MTGGEEAPQVLACLLAGAAGGRACRWIGEVIRWAGGDNEGCSGGSGNAADDEAGNKTSSLHDNQTLQDSEGKVRCCGQARSARRAVVGGWMRRRLAAVPARYHLRLCMCKFKSTFIDRVVGSGAGIRAGRQPGPVVQWAGGNRRQVREGEGVAVVSGGGAVMLVSTAAAAAAAVVRDESATGSRRYSY